MLWTFLAPLRSCGFVTVITLFSLLVLWAATLDLLHSYILFPGCAIIGLSSTGFCQRLFHHGPKMPRLEPLTHGAIFSASSVACSLPILSRFMLCNIREVSLQGNSAAELRLPHLLQDQLEAYGELVSKSSTTASISREFRDIVLSLDDIALVLKQMMFDNQQPALSHLSAIRLASRESARRLQKYSARLLSSVSVIMTAAQHTIAVSKTVSVGSYWSLQRYLKYFSIPVKEEQQLQKAFAHTIEAFDVFNRDLTHLNGETYESLLSLDGFIENFVDLIYDEALGEAREKLDELLNRLWTIMGGNRREVSEAKGLIYGLEKVGKGAQVMRSFVFDAQMQLDKLQTGVEELRAQAGQPLLIDGPIPFEQVVRALANGCEALGREVSATFSQSLDDGSLGGVDAGRPRGMTPR